MCKYKCMTYSSQIGIYSLTFRNVLGGNIINELDVTNISLSLTRAKRQCDVLKIMRPLKLCASTAFVIFVVVHEAGRMSVGFASKGTVLIRSRLLASGHCLRRRFKGQTFVPFCE